MNLLKINIFNVFYHENILITSFGERKERINRLLYFFTISFPKTHKSPCDVTAIYWVFYLYNCTTKAGICFDSILAALHKTTFWNSYIDKSKREVKERHNYKIGSSNLKSLSKIYCVLLMNLKYILTYNNQNKSWALVSWYT